MTDAGSKSFTSRKFDLLHRLMADRRVSDGQFRMCVRVLKASRPQSGGKTALAIIGDETVMDEVPSCGSPSTCKANRKKIQALGYWKVTPGHGKTTTEYVIDLEANPGLQTGLDQARLVRLERRRRSRQAWRQRKTDRHADDGPHAVGDGHADDGPTFAGQASMPTQGDGYGRDGGDGHADDGRTVMQDPPYTLRTPSGSSPSYRADEESRYLQGDFIDPDGVVIPRGVLSLLGAGDLSEGRRLAEVVPSSVMAEILDTALKFGAMACRDDIADAREDALEAIAGRASA